ncbi:cupin domain-containing protein [Rhizobium ruizarguesonis]|jgi:quercetin dioxygenase-like cupin family protein|uniref:cupin domain-containing protein n=1 Tax=Rhizobium ruizarguesonis TaxID=2081791 RepID=UPI0009495DF9|nr:cupin domain-containing protein [Rhizobium ruizarguesonis]MBY5884388.1 cupin domain-containing protein [Rhizobium leguminosarum]QIO45178.1 cupin domain-containing protein [Rhizobium leguminosarum bv. trifolii]QND39986.1 cupin domain-containing protein [Rhizobium leguminosarum bv. viciae]MBY5890996.1 cupin domain-containing protein [Rhizobium leguminosarum]MBY5898402.1 cupin domain-containing protein [Rhizobium leguminosarum]
MEAVRNDIVRIEQLELRFLISEAGATVFEFTVPSRARVPAPHCHRDADEFLYGLEGALTVIVDGQTREIRAGDAIFIPRGAVHHHENLHDGTAKVLATITPGTIGRRYFEEIAEVVNVPGKPNLAKANEIMLRHGLVPV